MMLAENIFPPIPSELIMPLAGFVAAQGQLNPVLVVLAGTLGSVLGACPGTMPACGSASSGSARSPPATAAG